MRLRTGFAALLAAALACGHAREVGEPSDGEAQGGDRRGASAAPPRVRPQPGHPSVAPSPGGLMSRGAARRIQDALGQRGYLAKPSGRDELDDATAAALRRFQRDERLPATGAPDRETLRRLGIDPSDVYRDEGTAAGR